MRSYSTFASSSSSSELDKVISVGGDKADSLRNSIDQANSSFLSPGRTFSTLELEYWPRKEEWNHPVAEEHDCLQCSFHLKSLWINENERRMDVKTPSLRCKFCSSGIVIIRIGVFCGKEPFEDQIALGLIGRRAFLLVFTEIDMTLRRSRRVGLLEITRVDWRSELRFSTKIIWHSGRRTDPETAKILLTREIFSWPPFDWSSE